MLDFYGQRRRSEPSSGGCRGEVQQHRSMMRRRHAVASVRQSIWPQVSDDHGRLSIERRRRDRYDAKSVSQDSRNDHGMRWSPNDQNISDSGTAYLWFFLKEKRERKENVQECHLDVMGTGTSVYAYERDFLIEAELR